MSGQHRHPAPGQRNGKNMKPLSFGLLALVVTLSSMLSGCAVLVVSGAVAATVTLVADRRTTGTLVEDESIELQAATAFREDPELGDKTHISVTSYNLAVLLTGQTPTEAQREHAGEIVGGLARVRRVHNELRIAAPTDLMSRSSDTVTTSRTKAALFTIDIEGFDPTKVKIVTEEGTVYLMGLLTETEADAVVEKVRRVAGVQRVVKVFEIVGQRAGSTSADETTGTPVDPSETDQE